MIVTCSRILGITLLVCFGMGGFLSSSFGQSEGKPDVSVDDRENEASSNGPRIVNIINFVRQCEPRIDWITEDVLYETVVKQAEMMQQYDLRGTFLLQYDALIDPRYQKFFKGLPADNFEIGAWWEIPQPLVESAGMKWRGRFPWDWHANVGFATGYTPAERELLVDAYMADFKKVFGKYPESVGSWFIDAHTLNYMHDKYGIVASCNCKDQIGTDGYTMWGGYWNQGYYPSRKNAYMPAQRETNQIPVPVFRMLGSDPIHQYDSGLGTERQRVISLEPVYSQAGGDQGWCEWYFDAFVNGPAMEYGYVQVGQENSFAWRRMKKGFEIQLPLVAQLRDQNKVSVRTLAETGKWFRDKYDVTPPTSVSVLKDHTGKDLKTVWFNSRFYRANLLWEGKTLRFRDIHLFDENISSNYLTQAGQTTRCDYDTLPVVDGFRWSTKEAIAGLRLNTKLGKQITGGVPKVDDSLAGKLVVQWPTMQPKGLLRFEFSETGLSITGTGEVANDWVLELETAERAVLPFREIVPDQISCFHKGNKYLVIASRGSFMPIGRGGFRVIPEKREVKLDFSRRMESRSRSTTDNQTDNESN